MSNVTVFEDERKVPVMNFYDSFPSWTEERWRLYDRSLEVRFMLIILFVIVVNLSMFSAMLMKNPRSDVIQRNNSLVINLCVTHCLLGIGSLFPPWHYMTIWPSQLHHFFAPNESMFNFMLTITSFYHVSLLICITVNVSQIIRLCKPSFMEPKTTPRGIITAVLLSLPWILGITTIWVLPDQDYTPSKIRVIEVCCVYFIPAILILLTAVALVVLYLYFSNKEEVEHPDLADLNEMKNSKRCVMAGIILSATTIFIGLPEMCVAVQEASACDFKAGCVELSSPRESYLFKLVGSVVNPLVWLIFPDIRKRFGRLIMCVCCCDCKSSSIYDDDYYYA